MSAISGIERRENLSYQEFVSKYERTNRPVVVKDAIRGWKALSRWTPEFFKAEFGDMKLALDNGGSGTGDYHGKGQLELTMAQFIDCVLDSAEENPAPYFRNQPLYDLFPSLRQDIEPLPDYFMPNWLPDRYLVKQVGAVLNRGAVIELYVGGKGGSFPVLHYDGAATHAFLMQIHGRKQFIIYPPDQEAFLYPSPTIPNHSLVNSVENPDLERFPLFAKAVPSTFVLEPGELLFVPSRWWHTTKMLTPSITVSINTANQSNWPALVNFVASRRRNRIVSLASRIYLDAAGAWRSWRDRDWQKRAQA